MTRHHFVLVVLMGMSLTPLAPAGIFFNRHPKPSPQRAQELVGALKSDTSESKRAAAADELGQFDGKAYPEVVPALLSALRDPAPEVRAKAVSSLAKMRPVSVEIGQAIEQTLAGDSAMRVRIQARTALMEYHVAGYRTPKDGPSINPPPTDTKEVSPPVRNEPPLAEPNRTPIRPMPTPAQPRLVPVPAPVKNEPPLAPPVRKEPPLAPPAPHMARPLPTGPSTPTLVPTAPPVLQKPPPAPVESGPSLAPPM